MSHAAKGKVAHLPGDIREELNQRIYDGQTGPQLVKWLKTLKCDGDPAAINEANLSEWKKRKYQEWLQDQKQMDRIKQRAELSMRMAKASGGSLPMSMVTRLAGQIDEQIDHLADDDLKRVTPLLNVILNGEALRLEAIKVQQKGEAIDLLKAKFQRDSCKLFLKWFDDEQARKIASGSGTKELKLERLVEAMWGKRPAASTGAD
jgi:hypothetical protein